MKIMLYLFLFLGFGEILIRADEKFSPFSKDDQVRIEIKMEQSKESKMVSSHTVPYDDSTFRIMVLGDSYMYGAAIIDSSKFSNLIRKHLIHKALNSQYKRCLVLDVSRPANNNLDNYNTYKVFNQAFKPQLIILAYNLNDINDDLNENPRLNLKTGAAIPAKQKDKPTFIKSVYNILYLSHVIQFSLHSFNSYLKSLGYIVPHSVFDEILRSYNENKPNWVKSKEILSKLVQESSANKQHLLVVLMPEFDLISNRKIFEKTDRIIQEYFENSLTKFVNPVDYYVHYNPKDLRLSKYDGHPNAYAHQILADSMIVYIRHQYLPPIR